MCTVNKTISRAQVQNILKNPFYIGYFINKGKTYKHNYPRLIDEDLFRIVQDTMEGRKRAPSKLYYGDKQYLFTGLVRCGCCGSLMTCETKVKDENHSYNYLKCNKLRSKCSQKPVNEAKILAQLEKELSLPLAINDDMLKNIKSEVKKRLKEENANTASLKRDITIKLNNLDEQVKTLFRGYIQGKCDEKMYNELKTEIELEKEKLQKDMDRYLEIDTETDEILANIAEVAANIGVFLKSPILSTKKEILRLILSDCKIEGKNLCFSITKPFDKLLKTPEFDKWCR
jgi:site-specific DNA recombinase